MGKRLLAFLIVPIILVAFVSCEGDIFGTISNFMGQAGENVLSDVTTVPSDNVDNLSGALAEVNDLDDDLAEVTVTVKTSVKEIIKSTGETALAEEALAEPIEDPEGETGLEADIRTYYTDELGLDADEVPTTITQADLAVVIYLKDIANETDATKKVETTKELVEFIKKTSPIGNINVLTAVNTLLTNMMDSEDRSVSRSGSREIPDAYTDIDTGISYSNAPAEQVDMLINITGIMKTILVAIDVDGNNVISTGETLTFKQDYAAIRKGYESYEVDSSTGEVTIGPGMQLSDLIAYVLSVVFTEVPGIIGTDSYPDETTDNGRFTAMLNELYEFLNGSEDKIDLAELQDSLEYFPEVNEFEAYYSMPDTVYEDLFGDTPDYEFFSVIEDMMGEDSGAQLVIDTAKPYFDAIAASAGLDLDSISSMFE